MEEEASVSFTTASGKEVNFQAKKGKAKAKKKVIETPVTPQEHVAVEPSETAAQPAVEEPVLAVEEPVSGKTESATPPESKPARKPKAKAKAPPGIPEKLPKKTKIERPPELPAPEPPPPPPEPQRFSREDMHSMIHEYMQANKRNSRDARINMYRSWLTA